MWSVFHCTQWLDSCSSRVPVVSQLSRPFSELKWFCWKQTQVNSWPLTHFPLSRTRNSLCSVTLQGVTAESPRPSDDRARARLNQWRKECWQAGLSDDYCQWTLQTERTELVARSLQTHKFFHLFDAQTGISLAQKYLENEKCSKNILSNWHHKT